MSRRWRGAESRSSTRLPPNSRNRGVTARPDAKPRKVYLDGVEDQAAFLEAYRAACVRHLPDGEIDYVRLRWRAVRRDDRSR